MSTSNISGQPERHSERAGRPPIHHKFPDGTEEWRYNPADLLPANVAQLDEVIRATQAMGQADITVGIVGQLEEPYENYEPADTTLYHPHTIRRTNFLRLLRTAQQTADQQARTIIANGGIPDRGSLEREQLREALSLATNHEWSEVYTVYVAEWVRPQ